MNEQNFTDNAPADAGRKQAGSPPEPGRAAPETGESRVFIVHLEPHSSNLDQTLAVAQGLRKEKWDIHIVCRPSCRLVPEAAAREIPVHLLPDEGKNLATAWKLTRIIRAVSGKGRVPVLVHACDPSASHVASVAWRLNKKLRIVHTRRVPIMESNAKAVRCYQVPPAKIVTDSLAGKIALRLSGLEPHLLHTIPCGIEPSGWPKRKERNDGRFVFALTGEMMPARGHFELYEALPHLEKNGEMPPWEVRIMGDGPHFADLLREAEAKGVTRNMVFLCGVGIGEELSSCDALVLPAPEGESYLPLILHGWAARVPLITVNRLDHAEVLQDEVNCLLVQPHDPESLAGKMALLANDPALRQRLVEGGRAALAKFSLQAMVTEHKRLYRGILA